MIRMKLNITDTEERVREVSIRPVTQVAFERHFKVGLASLSEDAKMEYIYWLAWDALRRDGAKPPEFDPWLDTIASVEMVDQDEEDTDPKVSSV